MGYLSCPICEKTELSDVQELQQKIATALCKSHSCPICSAEVQGLQAMHLHLASHIPIAGGSFSASFGSPGTPTGCQDQIPSLERLDIQDERYSPQAFFHKRPSSVLSDENTVNFERTERLELTPAVQYNCDLCGLVFWSDHFLNLHKDIMHSKTNSFEVTCKQCKSRFKDLEAYRSHVKEAHSDRRYICEQCPKSFKVKGGLLVHTRMYHDQSTPSVCTKCQKNFISKARKELHDRRYHPTNATYIGSEKTCLGNLHKTTNSVENLADELLNRHQKLGRQASSPAVLLQSSTIYGDSCSGINVTSHGKTINTDVEMKDTTDIPVPEKTRSNLSTPNCILSSKANLTNEKKCAKFFDNFNFLNSDLTHPHPIPFTQNPTPFTNSTSLKVVDDAITETNLNLKPPLNLETNDNHKNGVQYPSSTLCLPFILNYNKELMENNEAKIVSIDPSVGVCGSYRFSDKGSPPLEAQDYAAQIGQGAAASSDGSLRQVKDAMEGLFVDLPFGRTNDGLLQESIANTFPEGEMNQQQSSEILLAKKNNILCKPSENKQWECDDCKKCFTTKYFLKKHKRLHTGETPYCCNECGKNFTFQQSYHKHVFYHSDDKPHVCPHCGRAFKEMSTLHNHIRIHTGEKPFTCITCGKSFRQRVSYLVHQRIHTGQMPYHCDICNRSFRYKVSLRSHKCEVGEASEIPNIANPDEKEPLGCEILGQNLTTITLPGVQIDENQDLTTTETCPQLSRLVNEKQISQLRLNSNSQLIQSSVEENQSQMPPNASQSNGVACSSTSHLKHNEGNETEVHAVIGKPNSVDVNERFNKGLEGRYFNDYANKHHQTLQKQVETFRMERQRNAKDSNVNQLKNEIYLIGKTDHFACSEFSTNTQYSPPEDSVFNTNLSNLQQNVDYDQESFLKALFS